MGEIIKFLQQNGDWIAGLGMVFFAGVQVWLMFSQNRQQLLLKRLELLQQFDEIAIKFDGSIETAIEIQEWLSKHQSVFAVLLKKKDVKTVENLFNFLMSIRKSPKTNETQVLIQRVKDFNIIANKVTLCLGKARYGMTKENLIKIK